RRHDDERLAGRDPRAPRLRALVDVLPGARVVRFGGGHRQRHLGQVDDVHVEALVLADPGRHPLPQRVADACIAHARDDDTQTRPVGTAHTCSSWSTAAPGGTAVRVPGAQASAHASLLVDYANSNAGAAARSSLLR